MDTDLSTLPGTASLPGFWNASLPPPPDRPALVGEVDADVCIVGAGYTGLWTAWALLGAAPSLRVVLVEARQVGFGASGRNGGWLSGLMPGDRQLLSRAAAGRAGVLAFQAALIESVGRITAVCAEEGIDADIHVGGTLTVATTAAQANRLSSARSSDASWEVATDWLSASEVGDRVRLSGAVAGTYNRHCARIQPAKLVRGLAAAVERRGGVIFEKSPVLSVSDGAVGTPDGRVAAPWIVLATEGYTASLPGRQRRLLPMNSSLIVTEPLAPSVWDSIGWAGAETLADAAHAYVYLQRTADGRIAIGGRGVPYRFASRIDPSGTTPASTVSELVARLHRLFPQLPPDVGAAAAWSGVLGVARDWCPSVGIDAWRSFGPGATGLTGGGLAWAGGYVGDGVTTSHLAGLTIADLILGRSTARTSLPWVNRRARDWEPEPLRWLGVRTVYGLYRAADRAEERRPERGASSGWAGLADRLAGRRG
ncbi:MAG TPA: FAD-binding oxidoreductase [Acidimicrobiales bacterium]|nr:FAD-binding oxidoreductase [Acidimicrobiales bacterium]